MKYNCLLRAFGLLAGFVTLSQVCAQSLDAYWAGNGSLNDSSNNGNTLTNNGASFGPGYGQIKAFALNGSSASVSDQAPTFDIMQQASFTITLWANFNSFGNGAAGSLANVFVANDGGSGNQPKWDFFYDASTSSLAFQTGSANGTQSVAEAGVGVAPSENQWNMFTVTGSQISDSVSLYFDGQFLGTVGNMSFSDPAGAITIGTAENQGYFDGRLEDIGIFDSALTSSQVDTAYNEGNHFYNPLLIHQPLPGAPEAPSLAFLGLSVPGLVLLRRRRS